MMRQDRFTEGAQEVLAASQELVRKERHSQHPGAGLSARPVRLKSLTPKKQEVTQR